MDRLKSFLTDHYQGTDCYLYHRGSTGIYAWLKTIRDTYGPGEVIIPSVCCETVLMAILYAGMTPIIADVDINTLQASAPEISAKISDQTRAIIVVHIFGNVVHTHEVMRLVEGTNILIMDDIAQAAGAMSGSKPLGQIAHATLLSFADSKIIKGNGGALILREKSLLDAIISVNLDIKNSPVVDEREQAHLELSLRNVSHGCYDLLRANVHAPTARFYRNILQNYSKLVISGQRRIDEVGTINQIKAINFDRQARVEKLRAYADGLKDTALKPVKSSEGSTCWRASFILDDAETTYNLTQHLRHHNIPASNHYFPLNLLYNGEINNLNHTLSSCVLNLWVDDTVKTETIDHTTKLILDFFKIETLHG